MKKAALFLPILLVASTAIFAISSFTVESGIVTSEASPQYIVGVTIKSIGTIGFELSIEGNLGNSFDLTKLGGIKKWNFIPALFLSLPTGEIRPYAGLGISTVYDVSTSSFSPVSFPMMYYKGGIDAFFGAFSAFIEAQGSVNFQPTFVMGGIDEWKVGVGLTF